MDEFGERLRKLRNGRDMSQGDLAAHLGVVPSSVGKYERTPNSFPSVEVLIKLSDFFGVTIDYLLKGTETAPSEYVLPLLWRTTSAVSYRTARSSKPITAAWSSTGKTNLSRLKQ